MTELEALILGVVQGLTEFLPVSSSGHLELGAHFLGIESSNNLLFAIVVHAATALSTLVVFRKEIWELIAGVLNFKWNEATQYFSKILLSMIPVGIVGVFFEEKVEALFGGSIVLVAFMLAITGVLLLITNYLKTSKETDVSYKNAFIIGLAQAFAILPGISRSGATISVALMSGVSRKEAAKFSFIMVLIPILGAALLKMADYVSNPTLAESIPASSLVIGFVAAFISGFLACKWMISLVQKGKLIYFAGYCFIVASGTILFQILS